MCDLNYYFQNAEVTKLPWVKFIVGANGRVHKVKCKVCRKIKGHNKNLVSKLNSLWKHVSQRKAIITILNAVAMCRAPKFLVDPLEGPSMRQCGSGWNLGHDPDF
jgi:hypothetical protein